MQWTGTQTLETHRLILRRYRLEDAEDMFYNWASDPEVTRYLTWQPHTSVEGTRNILNDWIPCYAQGDYFNWAIVWKETGHVIGNIAAVELHTSAESADIGYCLGRAFWGRGIMPEALRAVMDYLFDVVGMQRVAARHAVDNPKSGRAMEKAGMHLEGILRRSAHNNQGIYDAVWHAALRTDQQSKEKKEKTPVIVRMARKEELPRVNELRRQVNELHVAGEPSIFKPGFPIELQDYIYEIFDDPAKEIVVAESKGQICGYAVLNHICKPETPFMEERDFLDVDEFCVDSAFRRQGIASAMIQFIKDWAKEQGFRRLELNMWEFNRDALAFYEASGFKTYRRYMEMDL